MLAELYVEKNAGRAQPCQQSRSDPYRIVHYDLAKAAQGSLRVQPLLLRRHNVATGMVLVRRRAGRALGGAGRGRLVWPRIGRGREGQASVAAHWEGQGGAG